jgi:hypothetical protein
MLVYDSLADPEAQPSSVCTLCGVESFKQVGFHIRTHAMAAVSHDDSNARLTGLGIHSASLPHQDVAAVPGSVKSIPDYVGKHLSKFARIAT